MLQEIRNLPLLISEALLERRVNSVVRESELKAETVTRYFRTAGHFLGLTYGEHKLSQVMLGLKLAEQDPRTLLELKVLQRVTSHFQQAQNQAAIEMGFLDENQTLANLIYSPLLDIAQLWVINYQDISILDQAIDRGPSNRHDKLVRLVKIEDLVAQTMEQSTDLVLEMRQLEKTYHPLESQLTFKP